MRAQKGEGINLSGREDGQIDTLRLSEHRNICIWGQDLRAVLTPGLHPGTEDVGVFGLETYRLVTASCSLLLRPSKTNNSERTLTIFKDEQTKTLMVFKDDQTRNK